MAKVKNYLVRDNGIPLKHRLASFLEVCYDNPDLKFDDLTHEFLFSRSHGFALFKKQLGMTFREKLREIRVAPARHLIEASHLSMKEVADQCGFHSAKRLCEAFIRIHGLSPIAYRNRYPVKVTISNPEISTTHHIYSLAYGMSVEAKIGIEKGRIRDLIGSRFLRNSCNNAVSSLCGLNTLGGYITLI